MKSLISIGRNLFAGTYNGGIFNSTNNGMSWIPINEGLSTKRINPLAINNEYLFASVELNGVYKRYLSEITDIDEENIIPSKFLLEQNYLNPFNPSTIITFSLPSKSFVTLKVFDFLGKEVATIVSEELSAGSHNREWNAGNLSSGVYFYRIQAGSFIETKKLILMK
ncbi:MAG TPA: T9SS type A sorting domain-containing protein [Ignavibacteriaceae bacterium]|nr:T9SS type A sorting domain-containing protein [Ignavibacteriaceae bacterium]